MSEKPRSRSPRTRENEVVRQGQRGALADASVSEGHRALGKNARCRAFVEDRLKGSSEYAKFAAAAGADILLDGEPIEGFKAVNKMDETLLRHRDLELRRDVFIAMTSPAKRLSVSG